jgi:hypothetical protein
MLFLGPPEAESWHARIVSNRERLSLTISPINGYISTHYRNVIKKSLFPFVQNYPLIRYIPYNRYSAQPGAGQFTCKVFHVILEQSAHGDF